MPRWPATQTRLALQLKRSAIAIAPTSRFAACQIARHHFASRARRSSSSASSRASARALAGIADQEIDLGRAEIARIDLDQRSCRMSASTPISSHALAAPVDLAADLGEGQLDEVAHRMRLAGRQHVIVGLVLLQHPPHALDIVAGMAPVALGIEIAEIELLLRAELDRARRARVILRVTKVSPRIGLS